MLQEQTGHSASLGTAVEVDIAAVAVLIVVPELVDVPYLKRHAEVTVKQLLSIAIEIWCEFRG